MCFSNLPWSEREATKKKKKKRGHDEIPKFDIFQWNFCVKNFSNRSIWVNNIEARAQMNYSIFKGVGAMEMPNISFTVKISIEKYSLGPRGASS